MSATTRLGEVRLYRNEDRRFGRDEFYWHAIVRSGGHWRHLLLTDKQLDESMARADRSPGMLPRLTKWTRFKIKLKLMMKGLFRMKRYAVGLLVLFLGLLTLPGASPPSVEQEQFVNTNGAAWTLPAEPSLFAAKEVQVDLFGAASGRALDPDEFATAAGVGVSYYLNRSIGVGLEGITWNAGHSFVDQGNLLLYGRLPMGRVAPYFLTGLGRDFEVRSWLFQAGGGVELRLIEHLGTFADIRWQAGLDTGRGKPFRDNFLARAGVRVSF